MLSILRVDFPYIEDPSQSKIRPALCLTKPIGAYELIVTCYITSRKRAVGDTEIFIDTSHPEFNNTGLAFSSVIQLHKLISISLKTSSVKGEIGILPKDVSQEVSMKLRNMFHY